MLGDARLLRTDVFKYDPKFLENEEEYKKFKAEVLGEDSDEEDGSDSDDGSEDETGKELTCDGSKESANDSAVEEKEGIQDKTETNLVNLRRVIYLTIMNAVSVIVF
jgi:pre-mRNA-splicing factor CWC22